jgi:hypothetical protein
MGVNDKSGGRVASTMLPSALERRDSLNVECNYSSEVFGSISINVHISVFQCCREQINYLSIQNTKDTVKDWVITLLTKKSLKIRKPGLLGNEWL